MSVRARDEVLPSPAAGLLQLGSAAGRDQSAGARDTAGVDRTMISAYEHDRRQPTLPTLLKLLKAAGFDLRMHLEPYDDHDDVLAERERSRSSAEQDEWEERQKARLAAVGSRRKPKAASR